MIQQLCSIKQKKHKYTQTQTHILISYVCDWWRLWLLRAALYSKSYEI